MGKQRCNWTSADKWYFISCNFVHCIIICRQEFMHLYKSKTFITVSVLELKMERKCSLRSTSPWTSQLEVRMKHSLVRDHSCFQWLYFMTIICRNCNNKLAIYIYIGLDLTLFQTGGGMQLFISPPPYKLGNHTWITVGKSGLYRHIVAQSHRISFIASKLLWVSFGLCSFQKSAILTHWFVRLV